MKTDFGNTLLSLKELLSLVYKNSSKVHLDFISPINLYKDNATVSGTDVVSVFLKPLKMWARWIKIILSSFRPKLWRLYTSDQKMGIIWSIKNKKRKITRQYHYFIVSVFSDTLQTWNSVHAVVDNKALLSSYIKVFLKNLTNLSPSLL